MKKAKSTGYKVSDLAKALKITTKSIYYLRANHGAPLSTDPAEWERFLERRAMETGYSRSTRPESKINHKLRLQLLRAQVGKEEANRKLRELELERQTENLVPIAEAKEVIRKVLEPLRSLLDALPKAAALQANPNDPILAEEAIRDGLRRVFQMMEEHLNDGAD
jgi:hypothetical protein